MKRWIGVALAVLTVAGCAGGDDGTDAGARPGDEISGMVVTTGTISDPDIFTYCDPIGPETPPEVLRRTCDVPALPRLRIGYGWIESSQELLDEEWESLEWELYLDGHEIALDAFGTLDDHQYYETSVRENVWLRQWNVMIEQPLGGEHTLRSVTHDRRPLEPGSSRPGTYETTWTFTVRGGSPG